MKYLGRHEELDASSLCRASNSELNGVMVRMNRAHTRTQEVEAVRKLKLFSQTCGHMALTRLHCRSELSSTMLHLRSPLSREMPHAP